MGKHYFRSHDTGGHLGAVVDSPQPARVVGLEQRAGVVIPADCPHCHARPPAWATDAHQGHCATCGATFFATQHEITRPRNLRQIGQPRFAGGRTRGRQKGAARGTDHRRAV